MLRVDYLPEEPVLTATAPREAIEARYKALGLTQESLAWVAGVSNSTVRNLLSGRVNVARTWPQVERALGWMPGSWNYLETESEPPSLLPLEALRSMIAGLIRIEGEAADEAREAFNDFAMDVVDVEHGRMEGAAARGTFARMRAALEPHLSPSELQPIADVGKKYLAMRPEDSRSNLTPAAGGDNYGLTSTLPARLQQLLAAGEVRDWSSAAAPDGTLNIVLVAVTNNGATPTNRDRSFWLRQLEAMDAALGKAEQPPTPAPQEDP